MDMLGIKPIREKFLEPNYLFAVEWREGFIFGRVVRRRICQFKPYAVVKSDGSNVIINAGAHQDELRFRDARNPKNEILYLSTSTNSGYPWFFHGAIGIKPQYVYMYPRFPEGKEIPGKFPNVDPIRPSEGDVLGYLNSLNSPYEEPTDYVEWVIPPGLSVGAEYYNYDTKAHQPVLNLLFALYWVQLFTKEKQASLIRRIAAREVPASFLTVGFGDIPQELGDTLKKEWKVEPMTLDQALGGA
jgi:hypothetical protein